MERNKLQSLLSQYRLKDRLRTGWVLREVSTPESVADHSWGTAHLVLLFAAEAGVNRERALALALVHDLAEAETGDFPRRVSPGAQPLAREEKAKREADAMARVGESFPELETLWREYEEAETAEALFVRDMNLIDMCLQALLYERDRRYSDHRSAAFPDYDGLDEFFATSGPRVSTDTGSAMFMAVESEYRAVRSRSQR